MKRKISLLIAVILLINTCFGFGLNVYAETYNDFAYEICDDDDNPYVYIYNYYGNNKTITIPNAIESITEISIGMGAFQFNDYVEKVVISKNVTSIGQGAFAACKKLNSIDVDSNNKYYKTVDGILFSKNNELLQYPAGKTDKKYTTPDYVTAIDSFAFQSTSIEEFDMGNAEAIGIWFDGYAMLENCQLLKKASVNDLGTDMFNNCNALNTVKIKQKISDIPMRCFNNCDSLTHIYYSGTISEWKALENNRGGEDKNDSILYATIHCTDGDISARKKRPKKKINAKDLKITLSKTKYVCDGKVKKPKVTVKTKAGKTVAAKNYSVTYSKGRKKIGKYTVTIKFKGNYTGTVKKTFEIDPKGTSLSNLTNPSPNTFKIVWKKHTSQTTGYQIQYSTDKNFKVGNKTANVNKNTSTNKTIKGLKEGKKYYVRVRTYKNVSGNNYYSKWSGSKNVTIRKVPKYTVILSKTRFVYDGKLHKPTVTIKDGKGNVVKKSKYSVTGVSSKEIGKYSIKVSFKDNYSPSINKTYQIVPSKITLNSADSMSINNVIVRYSINATSNGFGGYDGYRIQIAKDKSFKDCYEINYKAGKKDAGTYLKRIKNNASALNNKKVSVKPGTKYYVRVRGYKTVSFKNKYNVYSDWSATKSVRTVDIIKDSFFEGDSSKDYGEMAVIAACLSNAAYNKSTVCSMLKASHYTVLCQENYGAESDKSKKKEHHVAYTIANKDNNYVVVIRGTEGYEWISNGCIGNEKSIIHTGFEKASDEIYIDLNNKIGNNKNAKVFITGHSRGAAVANLLASRLNCSKLGEDNVFCYTFACPNVSSATTDDPNIFNYVNSADFVTTVPLKKWGFKRNGNDIIYYESKSQVEEVTSKTTKTLKFSSVNSKYLAINNAQYSSLTEATNNKMIAKMEKAAPTLEKYYSGYPHIWFEDLMKFKANNDFASAGKALAESTIESKSLKELTNMFVLYGFDVANTHDAKTYYIWVREYYK